jgi:hypothetical protein
MEVAQLTFDDYEARVKRDVAIATVAAHADENVHGWTTQAFALVALYATMYSEFIAEDCAEFAYSQGLKRDGIDPRAWGKVYKNAAKAKVIRKKGYAVSQKRNHSPTVLWASCHPMFAEVDSHGR